MSFNVIIAVIDRMQNTSLDIFNDRIANIMNTITVTLIGFIFTNNFEVDANHVQGTLCTAISDHYAVLHITGNASKSFQCDSKPRASFGPNMTYDIIVQFGDTKSAVDWR